MLLSKRYSALCLIAFATSTSSAFARETIKLNCPVGTVQTSNSSAKNADIIACVKKDSKGFNPHGPTVFLSPRGMKEAEGLSEDGFRTGLWTFYDEQGNKTGTATFKHSNFHGDVVELHENGKVKKVEQYVDGLREGSVKEFSADGTLVKQTEYRNNRQVAVK